MEVSIEGVGYKLEAELTAKGISTANDIRALSRKTLVNSFGDRIGCYLYSACRGEVILIRKYFCK